MEEKKELKAPTIESNVAYDDRRKEMIHTTKETQESEMGHIEISSKGVYHEEGIRKVLKDLDSRRLQLEQAIKSQKIETAKTPEMTEDLTKLKEQLTNLQKIDVSEKNKLQMATNQKDLVEVNKNLKQIKDAIGSRLKL